jgi:hypothetical protein
MIVAIDVPESILLSYQNLSSEVVMAEAQKDVLSQFFRSQYRNVPAVVEDDAGRAGLFTGGASSDFRPKNSRKLIVKCVQCGRSDGDGLLDVSSVRLEKMENKYSFGASFRVVNSDGNAEMWRVSVAPDSTRWCVRARNSIGSGRPVLVDDLEVAECQKDKGNARKAYFETEKAAKESIQSVIGFRLSRPIGSQEHLTDDLLSRPLAVLGQENVKVMVGGASALQIRTTGRALSSGVKGQAIRVQLDAFSGFGNRSSGKRIVDAIIVAPGEVSYVR